MLKIGNSVLVTGGTGLIGSNLVNKLRLLGHNVHSVGSEIDLRCPTNTDKLFRSVKPSVVFHMAAKVGGIHANSAYKTDFYFDNVMINTNVVKSALDCGTAYFFGMGTGCAYPKRLENSLLSESSYLDGIPEVTNDAYAYAKRGLLVHLDSVDPAQMRYSFCIPANIYGPFDNFHPENSHVVPGLIQRFYASKCSQDKSVTVWGNGKAQRDFLYIDDCIDAIIHMASNALYGSYNVSSGKLTSILQLAENILNALDYQATIEFDSDRLTGQSQRIFDNSKITSSGWTPKYSLEYGIVKTVEWYSENTSLARKK